MYVCLASIADRNYKFLAFEDNFGTALTSERKHYLPCPQSFFLSFTERSFFRSRRLWCVCNQPIEAFVLLCRALREFCS